MKVTIYHTTNCAFCKVEMEWLDKLGIHYNHINIEEDEEARTYLAMLGIQGVPVTVIHNDDIVIKGFNRKALIKALSIS